MGRKQHALPIFPLSNVSLFPGVHGLFHIFEPRYRQMTEQVLAGDGKLAMAVVLPECTDEMAGDPPVYPVACAGVIRDSQRLADGRYHVVLLGTHRVRILEEPGRPPDRLYRAAVVEELDDAYDPQEAGRVATMRSRIVDLVHALTEGEHSADGEGFEPERFDDTDDANFVNTLCKDLPLPTREKQSLLQADGIPARFECLIGVLEFSLAAAEARKVPNSGSVH